MVSSFNGKGKKTAFATWEIRPETPEGLLGEGNFEKGLPLIEQFVVSMYHKDSNVSEVNKCRR